MRRIKVNKFLILIVFFAIGVLSMGASSWLIINEQSGSPSFNNVTYINHRVEIKNALTTDTAIYETDALKVTTGVPGVFCYGSPETILATVGEDNLDKVIEIPAPIDISGSGDTMGVDVRFIPDQDYLDKNNYELQDSNKNRITTKIYLKAVAYVGNDGAKTYSSIQKAISVAESSNPTSLMDVVVIVGTFMDITRDIDIPAYINLVVPFSNTVESKKYTGYTYTIGNSENSDNKTRIKALFNKDEKEGTVYSDYSDGSSSKVENFRKISLNMKNGADIIINSNAQLSLGGEYGITAMKADYTEVTLDTDSCIECNGKFFCEGYVKENSSSAKNGNQVNYKSYMDNSFDSGRYVRVNEGGYLECGLSVYDMKSGGSLTSLNSNGIFPINKFDFASIQTYVEIIAGGRFYTHSHYYTVLGSGDLAQEVYVIEDAAIIETTANLEKNVESVFYLTSGKAAFEYCPNSVLYTSGTALTKILLDGVIEQGSMTLKVSGVDITTKDKFIPLSNRFNIFINSGSNYNISSDIKLLPGSIFQINNGGNLEVNADFIVYPKSYVSLLSGYGGSSTDATFINNGSLVVGTNGKIGAFIQTTATDNSAVVDLSGIQKSALTVSSVEGSIVTNVTISTEGYFEDESDVGKDIYKFVAGSTVNSASSGAQVWSGEKDETQTLTISIAETVYKTKVYDYKIYTATDSNGTGSTELTGTTGMFTLEKGQYVKIAATRHLSATINSATESGELNVEKWYFVDSDIAVVITPSEAILLNLRTDSLTGNGYATYTVYESESEESTSSYVKIFEKEGISTSNSIYIIKNRYFYITYSDFTLSGTKVEKGEIIKGPENLVGTTITSKTSSKYQATEAYEIYYNRIETGGGFPCVTPDTLITMADGTRKEIQNVRVGDEVLAWNFYTGKYEVVPVSLLQAHSTGIQNVLHLKFEDGTELKLLGEHGVYDADLNTFVFIDEYDVEKYLGHNFIKQSGDTFDTVKLVSYSVTTEYTTAYTILSTKHYNVLAEGMFTVTPAHVGDNFFNPYEVGENMKYDEEKMQADIEKYGLYTYEDFAEYVTYEQFIALNLAELKVSVGKRYITYDGLVHLIVNFVNNEDYNVTT